MIGSGYVGLVSGACLADLGHQVICVDRDAERVAHLEAGECPIYEPGLPEMLERTRRAARLDYSTDMAEAVSRAEAVLIAVGTPSAADGSADLAAVYAVAAEVASHARGFTVLITKSTVPPGTGDGVEIIVRQAAPQADIAVASNPKFLREGSAIQDFMQPDRIVVGCTDVRAAATLETLYAPLVLRGAPLLVTDRRTAELIKYASNAFLAVKIGFANQIADLCEAIGADALKVSDGMGLDTRIGSRFLAPGPGYGGSCFPKDTLALLHTAQTARVALPILASTVASNTYRKAGLGARIVARTGDLTGRTVALLGLTFKAHTDDIRESAALDLVPDLLNRGAKVRAHDPQGMEAARQIFPRVDYFDTAYGAASGADVLVLLTEWPEFRAIDPARLAAVMTGRDVIDFRNLLPAEQMGAQGFRHVGIGRGWTGPQVREIGGYDRDHKDLGVLFTVSAIG